MTPFSIVICIVVFLVLLPLLFLPSIIAYKKQHKYFIPILIINLVGNFAYGIGWVIALVWCFIEPKTENGSTGSADEIGKLFELKEKGIISQAEFDRKKKALIE